MLRSCFQFHSIIQLFSNFFSSCQDRLFHCRPIMSSSSYKWKATHRSNLYISYIGLIILIALRWMIIFLSRQNTLGDFYILRLLVVNPCFTLVVVKLYSRNWGLSHFWVLRCLRSCIDESICSHSVANWEFNLLEPLHSFWCREVDCGTYSLVLLINWILIRMLVLIDKSLGRYRPNIERHFLISWLSENFNWLSCCCLTLLG